MARSSRGPRSWDTRKRRTCCRKYSTKRKRLTKSCQALPRVESTRTRRTRRILTEETTTRKEERGRQAGEVALRQRSPHVAAASSLFGNGIAWDGPARTGPFPSTASVNSHRRRRRGRG